MDEDYFIKFNLLNLIIDVLEIDGLELKTETKIDIISKCLIYFCIQNKISEECSLDILSEKWGWVRKNFKESMNG